MGQFSIPSIMPSQVLSGAIGRWREHQEADIAGDRARRDAYIAHLGQLMNVARDGDTINWLSNEIVRAEETPDEKLKDFKGKPLPVPMSMQPAGTPQPGAPKAGAGSDAGATPPEFNFSHVMQAITGQSVAPDDQGGGGSDSGGDVLGQVGVIPPALSGSPFTASTPSLAPTSLATPFTGAVPQLTPSPSPTPSSGLPSVAMTPPGHSLPEPAPLVGSLPGMTPPGLGPSLGIGPSGGQPPMTPPPMPASMAGVTPAVPPPAPHVMSPAALGGLGGTAGATPPPFQPQFMGLADKANLAASLKKDSAPDKSDPTPANMVAAARAHQVFQQAPDGTYFLRPMTKAELSLLDTSKLDTDQAHIHSMQMQDTLRTAQTNLANLHVAGLTPGTPQYEGIKAARERTVAVQAARIAVMQHNSERADVGQEARLWGTAHGVPIPGAMTDPTTGQTLGLASPEMKALAPTAMARNKADQGRVIINQGNDLIRLISDNGEAFGAWDGRVNLLRKDLGISDPTVREIYTRLRSYAALQPQLHGARGVGVMQEFEDAVGRLKENPDAVVASINALNSMAGEFVAQVGNIQYAHPAAGAGAGAGAGVTPPSVNTKPVGGTSTSTSATTTASTTPTPKVGDTKKFPNGRVGKYDGHGWVAQ